MVLQAQPSGVLFRSIFGGAIHVGDLAFFLSSVSIKAVTERAAPTAGDKHRRLDRL